MAGIAHIISRKPVVEHLVLTKETRHKEIEQTPKLVKVILQRSSC